MNISVLIPAFRAGKLIDPALRCLRQQTFKDWELVVVEDGSADETEAKVQTFAASIEQSVRYYNLGTNRGIATARNEALAHARGELVAFLDADDYWDDHYLAAAVNTIQRGKDLVISTVQAFDLATGRYLFRRVPQPQLMNDPVATQLLHSSVVTSSSVVFKRSLCDKVGSFDLDLVIGEDRDYWLRCALGGARFGIIPGAVAYYAKHPGSSMNNPLRWSEADVLFQRKYHDHSLVKKSLRCAALSIALEHHGKLARNANPRRGLASLIEAWQLTPWRLGLLPQAAFSLLKMAVKRGPPSSS